MSYAKWRPFLSCGRLWPSDAILRQGSGSTLAQVMTCCLTAPSHCLNQCWLIFCGVLYNSPEVNSTGNAYESNHYNAFENDTFKIKVTTPRGQWVNMDYVKGDSLQSHTYHDFDEISVTDASEVVTLIISGAASDDFFIKLTKFVFLWLYSSKTKQSHYSNQECILQT